jgi:predicted alpha/beta hydrolase family esterase
VTTQPDEAGARPILIIPGLHDSAPDHWQSHWQRTLPNAARVEQSDWERPTLGDWVASLVESIRQHPGAVLVGHSLGCALVAHLARLRGARGIAGALLVAPADVNRDGPAGQLLRGFGPMPVQRLPFPSLVVASQNDPYVSYDHARLLAEAWGARFVDAGLAGHINVASGHGAWPEGLRLLEDLIDRIDYPAVAGERGVGAAL